MFFIVAGLVIVNNNGLHLSNENDLETFSEIYYGWLDEIYSNIFNATGHVSKLSWLPEKNS